MTKAEKQQKVWSDAKISRYQEHCENPLTTMSKAELSTAILDDKLSEEVFKILGSKTSQNATNREMVKVFDFLAFRVDAVANTHSDRYADSMAKKV